MNGGIRTTICLVSLATLVACGGGANESQDSADSPAKFAGALQMLDLANVCTTQAVAYNASGASNGFKTVQGFDGMLFGEDNVGYRICGDYLWAGKFSGVMTSPSAGSGTASMNIYLIGRSSIRSTGRLTGIVLSDGMKITQVDMGAEDVSVKTRLQSAYTNYAYVNAVTGSYATLAGSYISSRAKTGLEIHEDGTFSGTTDSGPITGKITKFNPATHVHSVSITFNPNTNFSEVTTGVLGPYSDAQYAWSITPGGKGSSSIMLAVTGANIGYADVLSQK